MKFQNCSEFQRRETSAFTSPRPSNPPIVALEKTSCAREEKPTATMRRAIASRSRVIGIPPPATGCSFSSFSSSLDGTYVSANVAKVRFFGKRIRTQKETSRDSFADMSAQYTLWWRINATNNQSTTTDQPTNNQLASDVGIFCIVCACRLC